MFALTETRLKAIDTVHKIEPTLPGSKLFDHPLTQCIGGGTALLLRDSMHPTKVFTNEFHSFEYSEWIVKCSSHWLRLVIAYRPPYSANYRVTTSTFFEEFATYLDNIILSPQSSVTYW